MLNFVEVVSMYTKKNLKSTTFNDNVFMNIFFNEKFFLFKEKTKTTLNGVLNNIMKH